MTWRRALLYGLVFGVAGLAYAAWRGKQDRDLERRRQLAALAPDNWCTCTDDRECEGHRA